MPSEQNTNHRRGASADGLTWGCLGLLGRTLAVFHSDRFPLDETVLSKLFLRVCSSAACAHIRQVMLDPAWDNVVGWRLALSLTELQGLESLSAK